MGTAIVRASENGADLAVAARAASSRGTGAEVVPTRDELGRGRDLAGERPGGGAQGAARGARLGRADLERVGRLGPLRPGAALRPAGRPPCAPPRCAGADLTRYDVIVLPAGDYTQVLGDDGVRRLKEWVRLGGTLDHAGRGVAMGRAREGRPARDDGPSCGTDSRTSSRPPRRRRRAAAGAEAPFDLEQAIQPEREPPDAVPGAILRVSLDPEHWLTAGLDGGDPGRGRRAQRSSRRSSSTRGATSASTRRRIGWWRRASRGRIRRSSCPQKAFLLHQPIGRGPRDRLRRGPELPGLRREQPSCSFINAVLLGPAH